jgi:hypothetical protein
MCDRWAEELVLVEHEMKWTLEFFLFKVSTWLTRMTLGDSLSEGHKCYAMQQAKMYQELATHTEERFSKANPMFQQRSQQPDIQYSMHRFP